MADIKQAAKWMLEGAKVRRTSLPVNVVSCYLEPNYRNSNVMAWEGHPFAFIAADFLADDWEIDHHAV